MEVLIVLYPSDSYLITVFQGKSVKRDFLKGSSHPFYKSSCFIKSLAVIKNIFPCIPYSLPVSYTHLDVYKRQQID